MTVNYTTLLALGQPVTGTESGTWGDDVNNAVTSYLDIAIAGTLSLTSASFTANALTLANTQGSSSATNIGSTTAQYMIIKVSSLAANVTITAPSTSKIYLVDNTDATYTVTIKASGQTGYAVPVSTKAWVYFNGTDYVRVATSSGTGDVTGPASATADALVAFNGTTGKIIKQAATVTVAQGGTGAATLTANNVLLGNGTSAVQFVAPSTSGNVLTSNGTTWSSQAPASGGITYTAVTTNTTATDKAGYLANTAGGAFTITLPATPSTGAQVFVADAGGSWGTNNLTIGRNGSTIEGAAENLVCDISGISVQLVYSGTTWEVYAQIGGNSGTVVTLTGTQTLTNKTLTTPTITGTREVNAALAASAIDLATGNYFTKTISATTTFTVSNVPASNTAQGFILQLTNGGSQTVNWFSGVKWSSGVAPTLTSSGVDLIGFYTVDGGTTWRGLVLSLDSK